MTIPTERAADGKGAALVVRTCWPAIIADGIDEVGSDCN